MGGEADAAGDVLTGAVIAGTIENATNAPGERDAAEAAGTCRNCGAALSGAYCANCGQSARIHRSLRSIGHEILHGVFHFEGKVWRTLPELFFHPGRLTRRYIDGERARFVSPMALFLFTVFLMFAVFAFTGGLLVGDSIADGAESVKTNFKAGNESGIKITTEQLAQLRAKRESPDLTPAERAQIDEQIVGLESSRAVMEALASGNVARLSKITDEVEAIKARESGATAQSGASSRGQLGIDLDGSWPKPGSQLYQRIKEVNENPQLLLYKLKTNGYKFSWALIPLSIPFMWLLFFWRRDIHLYDHAVFVTYSITFLMLFLILLSIAASIGVPGAIWGTALAVVPPIHLYKHLRGTYGLSRFGTVVRLFVLTIAITIVLTIFSTLLLTVGVLT
jgi:Protein of unknown function (DUF3667)